MNFVPPLEPIQPGFLAEHNYFWDSMIPIESFLDQFLFVELPKLIVLHIGKATASNDLA
jgi:hypothetical protein